MTEKQLRGSEYWWIINMITIEDTKNQGKSNDGKKGNDLDIKALHKCGVRVRTDVEISR